MVVAAMVVAMAAADITAVDFTAVGFMAAAAVGMADTAAVGMADTAAAPAFLSADRAITAATAAAVWSDASCRPRGVRASG